MGTGVEVLDGVGCGWTAIVAVGCSAAVHAPTSTKANMSAMTARFTAPGFEIAPDSAGCKLSSLTREDYREMRELNQYAYQQNQGGD